MPGVASVPAFYIVSGFLITLVLREKYRDRTLLFYSNRALRIYPLYWASLIVFVVVNWLVLRGHLSGGEAYQNTSALWWADHHGHEVGFGAATLLTFSNLFIIGQDAMLFIGQWPHLTVRDYFYHQFMYVGPAWTIAVEFSFYAVAPFIVRRNAIWPASLLLLSLAARFAAIGLGHREYIDAYDFPPYELAFFMAGSLAYRAYERLRSSKSGYVNLYTVLACTTMVLLTVFYLKLPLARPLYLVATAICLPGIVLAGRYNPLDRICGELSYPIYLLHPILTIFIVPGSTWIAEYAAVGCAIGLSLVLIYFVERPIEVLRQRRAAKQIATMAPQIS